MALNFADLVTAVSALTTHADTTVKNAATSALTRVNAAKTEYDGVVASVTTLTNDKATLTAANTTLTTERDGYKTNVTNVLNGLFKAVS